MIHSEFVLSAASASDFPSTGFPEIAMVGRSNVGKSSLINALVRKTVARTSAAPGKTRLANYYQIESRQSSFYLVDLPGYGYARGGRKAADEFDALTRQFFSPSSQTGRSIAGVLHLIDARHPDLESDTQAHQWLAQTGVPCAVVATKMDKLKRADTLPTLRLLRSTYDTIVLPESTLDRTGLDEIWKTIQGWL